MTATSTETAQLLFKTYKKCYLQRAYLSAAPALTLDLDKANISTFDYDSARRELGQVISYLLSVRDVNTISVQEALNITRQFYQNQPFWKGIILDWLEFTNREASDNLEARAKAAKQQAENVLHKIQEADNKQKAMITAYANAIKAKGFRVNAEKLIQNYFNMARKDKQQAWATLTSNPGFFSPILVCNPDGTEVLTPKQAQEENDKLAKFLKKLSV